MNADTTEPAHGPDAVPGAEPDPPQRRPLWKRLVSPLLLGLVLVFVIVALQRNWAAVRSELDLLSVWDLVAATAAVVGALIATWLAWHLILRHLGGRLAAHPSQVLFFSSQVSKYVPGSVWPALIAARIGLANGVPTPVALGSYLLGMLVTVATGLLLTPLLLIERSDPTIVMIAVAGPCAGVTLLALAAHRGGLHRLAEWASRRSGRSIPSPYLPPRVIVPIAGVQVVSWAFFGLHVWLLARPLGTGVADLLPVVAAFALAFAAGLVVFPLPAGAGVREAVLMIALEPSIGRAGALSVAVLSRFVIIAAELGVAAVVGVPHAIRAVKRGDSDDELL